MMKEPEIKLFGRTIVFPENGGEYSGVSSVESGGSVDCDRGLEVSGEKQGGREGEENWERAYEGEASVELSETTAQDGDENTGVGTISESQNTNAVSELDNSPKSDDTDAASANHAETANEQAKKTLQKPDKILPCPRCNSADTKFCYYNNYNVNQPRYFCRSCQRYWTAGGTMRNVPVGAGRRKNKNLAPHCRHIMISEDLPAVVPIDSNGNQEQNGTVLSFGTVPSTAGKGTADTGASNGQENARDCKNMLQPPHGFLSPVPCIPGFPWPVQWNSAVPIPTGYLLPYYPAPYWSCPLPNAWNVPLPPQSSANGNEPNASNPSSRLGKHSRNGQPVVVPKTLRISDPEEAAKSSIWTTLGIKHGSLSKGGLFAALQPKADDGKSTATASPLLQANPAALSRSIRFRESA